MMWGISMHILSINITSLLNKHNSGVFGRILVKHILINRQFFFNIDVFSYNNNHLLIPTNSSVNTNTQIQHYLKL